MNIFKSFIDALPKLDKPQLLLAGFGLYCYSVLKLDNKDKQLLPDPLSADNEKIESHLNDDSDNVAEF